MSSPDSVIDRTRQAVEVRAVKPEQLRWRTVDFEMQPQCHSNWCWAAVAASVAAFHDKTSKYKEQCEIANAELKRSDCCNYNDKCGSTLPEHVDKLINRPFVLGSPLDLIGCLREENPAQATPEQVLAELDNGRPLCALTLWLQDDPSHGRARGGAHFLAIVGYRADTDALVLADPFYGLTPEIGFEQFCTDYQVGGGRWVKTYYLSCDKDPTKA